MIGAVIAAAALAMTAGGAGQPEPRAVVWAVGDGADGSAPARRLARMIERDEPDAVLYLGDVYPSGTAEDYERNFEPVYGRLASIMWPTAGNHEWGNREVGYYPYWRQLPAGAALVSLRARGLGADGAELGGPARAGFEAAALARTARSPNATPPVGLPSGTARASAPAPSTATLRTWRRSGSRCETARAWCSTATSTC